MKNTNRLIQAWINTVTKINGASPLDLDTESAIEAIEKNGLEPVSFVSNMLLLVSEIVRLEAQDNHYGARTVSLLLAAKQMIESCEREVFKDCRIMVASLPAYKMALASFDRKIFYDIQVTDHSSSDALEISESSSHFKCYEIWKSFQEKNRI